jgi:hypothetical protein
MKLVKNIMLVSLIGAASSYGAVTLTISSNAAGFGVLSNLQNSSGVSAGLVWGIVVSGNDGIFQGAVGGDRYDPSFTYTNTTTASSGFALTINDGVATDDRLYISTSLMANTADGAANLFRPTLINNVTLGSTSGGANPLVNPGDSFAIIWFDATTFGAQSLGGQKYGIRSVATTPDLLQPLVLGNDTSGLNYSKNFIGAEVASPAKFRLHDRLDLIKEAGISPPLFCWWLKLVMQIGRILHRFARGKPNAEAV